MHADPYLVCEGAGHDEAGVSRGTPQVHETPLSQHNDAPASLGEHPAVRLGLDGGALHTGVVLQAGHVDLIVEMPNVAHDGIVLHLDHVLDHDDVPVSGGGDKDVRDLDDLVHGLDLRGEQGARDSVLDSERSNASRCASK
jgi:hypothetical protein